MRRRSRPRQADVDPTVVAAFHGPGRPLESGVREHLQAGLRHDLGSIRLHDDPTAASAVDRLGARAVAVGSDIAFGPGRYDPDLPAGRALLAHEVWHTVQQAAGAAAPAGGPEHDHQADAAASALLTGAAPPVPRLAAASVQRNGMGDVRKAEHRAEVLARRPVRYLQAKQSNQAFDRRFAFGTALATVDGGRHRELAVLWNAGRHDAFADAVAGLQYDLNLPEAQIDGVLGPATWWRIAGQGAAMAAITDVHEATKTEPLCFLATKERMERSTQMATGRPWELPKGASQRTYDTILATHEWRMAAIPLEYRGTGAAGALVYTGQGTFVTEADVWNNGLRPGAALQVWGNRADYDLLRAGSVTLPGGGTRPITADDAPGRLYGTSFVFVRYDGTDAMTVRHFGRAETMHRADFDVWIAANTNT